MGGHLGWTCTIALSLIASRAVAQDTLTGTAPGDLTQDVRSPSLCASCHGDHGDFSAMDNWEGTMMANATRDPLFHAALTIANQDIPGSGQLCIRCHSPRAFLFERADPPDLSLLEVDDFEGVSCDFCHRLELGPDGLPSIGSGQYWVADDYVRRGPIEDPQAPHETEYSAYFAQSEFCGLCHDVSNPYQDGFPIERTYSEWAQSAFADEGPTCQGCHLPAENAYACGAPNMPEREVHRHELAGGNTWMPLVFAGEYPELGRQAAYEATSQNAYEMLRSAARVTLDAPDLVAPADGLSFVVRVENLTGHKLPTGYPEGRRSWLWVRVLDADGATVWESGAYDDETATRQEDEQLRTYEVRMAVGDSEGFHFVLQNKILQDNRIPPRGFVPDEDTVPVGRDYPQLDDGTLANWDDAPYQINLSGSVRGPLSIEAALIYQTTSREYVEFLRDNNHTDDRGDTVHALWEEYDRAPPVQMAEAQATVVVSSDSDGADSNASGSSGEGCQIHQESSPGPGWSLWLIPAWLVARGRRAARRAE